MLLSEEVEILLGGSNIKYYEKLGYEIPRHVDKQKRISIPFGTKIKVKLKDVSKGSSVEVQYLCDYCLEEGIETVITAKFYTYNKSREKIQKDCCNNTICMKKKREESLMKTYNVKHMSQIDGVQEKKEQIMIEKYGETNISKTDYFKEKYKEVMQQNYGDDFFFRTDEFKFKSKETQLKRYGVENYSSTKECRIKVSNTMYKNGSCMSSSQQKHLCEILGGILNYAEDIPNLDIGFPNEKIYIEYDGGGHDLAVQLGTITEEEFHIKQIRRSYYMRHLGWREIRIVSMKNLVPSYDKVIEIFEHARQYLNSGHSWIIYDIDNNTIKCSQYIISYNFGKLHKTSVS